MPLGKLKKHKSLYIYARSSFVQYRMESGLKWNILNTLWNKLSKTKTISEEEVDDQRIINSKNP